MAWIKQKGYGIMIGRKKEIKELNKLYNGKKSELVAIYGRHRIGKTYLIDETFKGRITFRHAGLSPVDENKKGMLKAQLEKFLEEKDDGSRQLVFLDELPWMDTPEQKL